MKIAGVEQSNDKDTGCLVLEGGLGVEKNVNIGGHLNITGIATFGSANFSGGTFGNVQIAVTGNQEIDTKAGELLLDSSNGQVKVDDNLYVTGITTLANGQASTSGSTGALVVTGGVGIGGDLSLIHI